MSSLRNFLKYSKQFNKIKTQMFYDNYKIDHYAYRTFDMHSLINKLKKNNDYFLEKDEYSFGNNVSARWMSRGDDPFIFVSQYNGILEDNLIKSNSSINLDKLNFYIKNPVPPEFDFYKQVNKYHQYLGSTLLFRNQINHAAFLVNDIEETCEEIKNKFPKYTLNNPEQPIQVSQDKELLQFSINADLVDYEFADGVHKVPFNFIEFVERKNGRRGFEGKNAQKIFTSTNYKS